MLSALQPDTWHCVRSLFEPLQHNLIIRSILDGHTRGRVFADNAVSPTAALIWNEMDTLLLAGSPTDDRLNQELCRLIEQNLLPEAQSYGVPGFTLQVSPHEWLPVVETGLAGLHQAIRHRHKYSLCEAFSGPEIERYTSMRSVMIDEALLTRSDLLAISSVRGWVSSFWPSPAAFARQGIGFCLVDGDTIASWCLSVYAADREMEFGVETARPYRGRGLASAAAAECLRWCAARGITPHWHCDSENLASVRVAEKIGFERAMEYTAIYLS